MRFPAEYAYKQFEKAIYQLSTTLPSLRDKIGLADMSVSASSALVEFQSGEFRYAFEIVPNRAEGYLWGTLNGWRGAEHGRWAGPMSAERVIEVIEDMAKDPILPVSNL